MFSIRPPKMLSNRPSWSALEFAPQAHESYAPAMHSDQPSSGRMPTRRAEIGQKRPFERCTLTRVLLLRISVVWTLIRLWFNSKNVCHLKQQRAHCGMVLLRERAIN